MRLLFAYAEFLNQDGTEKLYHGFSHLSLNFSVDQRFSYHGGILSVIPLERPIPTDFFGERIYNVTTLVGDNGVGKTTILHYLINLLQQLHEGRYRGNDRGLLVIEEQGKKYVLEYHGEYRLELEDIPSGMERIPFLNKESALLSATKLIYIANTLTQSDLELAGKQLARTDSQQANYVHFRHRFLYNCSTASLMIENCHNDCRNTPGSAAGYLNCFFFYEQYKQVKYVFDRRQHEILEDLQKAGHPVPVPKKLTIELLRADHDAETGNTPGRSEVKNIGVDTLEDPHDWLLYELCIGCVDGFLRCIRLRRSTSPHNLRKPARSLAGWTEFYSSGDADRKTLVIKALRYIYSFYSLYLEAEDEDFVQSLYENCRNFIRYLIDKKECLREHFEMDPRYAGRDEPTITFSIKTTGDAAEWFITFLQKYRYTCEPYYYLQFHWGLSSGEQNLLRLFSSLYYIFDADFNNPERGNYTIYTERQGRKVPCDSVMLWIDEADLTYHPEWQRCFLSILTAFLLKIYPDTCCRVIQIFLTTHSPLMLGDSPAQSVIYLSKDSNGDVIIDDSGSRPTFGENLYVLLQRSFQVQDSAIGEVAQIKIRDILDTLREIDDRIAPKSESKNKPKRESKGERLSPEEARQYRDKLQRYKQETVALLADGIIKAKLETEINRRLWQLEQTTSGNEDARLRDIPLQVLIEEVERRKEESE